jgi:hypothetical protein
LHDHAEDIDYWVLTAQAGDTIYVDIDANEFHSTMVPFATLLAGDGTTVLVDGREWDGLDPYLVYPVTTSGTYYVRIYGLLYAGRGSSAFYTINFRRTACPIVAAEAEPNDSQASAKDLPLNSSISALSCPIGDPDVYRIAVTRPSKVAVELRTPEQWRPVFGEAVDMTARVFVTTADNVLVASAGRGRGVRIRCVSSGTPRARARTSSACPNILPGSGGPTR